MSDAVKSTTFDIIQVAKNTWISQVTYRPPTKLQEGNNFGGVCLSTGRGGVGTDVPCLVPGSGWVGMPGLAAGPFPGGGYAWSGRRSLSRGGYAWSGPRSFERGGYAWAGPRSFERGMPGTPIGRYTPSPEGAPPGAHIL